MDDLIEALTIFRKYRNEKYPTHCEHDELIIVGVTFDEVSEQDRARLKELGFLWSGEDEEGHWFSFRFGSA